MSQSDLYDFFSYVARDGKGNAESPAAAMTRRTSVMSSASSTSSESGTPTPASTTTRATATPALMPSSRSTIPSSPSSTAAPHPRLTADEITARILESPEHHALCELISGRHDHDDDYARRSADKYRAFVDLAARLEAQKMPPPPRAAAARSGAFGIMMQQQQQQQQHQKQHEQSRREWNSLWW